MKKDEAQSLSKKRVDLIMEYIEQIIGGNDDIYGEMLLTTARVNGERMCTLEILVKEANFERHINLGITIDHINILYKEFLDRVISDIVPSETLGAGKIITNYGKLSTKLNILNESGGIISIDLPYLSSELKEEYNNKISELQRHR